MDEHDFLDATSTMANVALLIRARVDQLEGEL